MPTEKSPDIGGGKRVGTCVKTKYLCGARKRQDAKEQVTIRKRVAGNGRAKRSRTNQYQYIVAGIGGNGESVGIQRQFIFQQRKRHQRTALHEKEEGAYRDGPR
jgi:hypothetical protein